MTIIPSDTTPTRADLLDEIARWRDRVLTLDRIVEERRVSGAERDATIRERDRAAEHLRNLIEWAEQQVAA